MTHIIDIKELELHEESIFCKCVPHTYSDGEGNLTCIHLPLTTTLKGITNEPDNDEPDIFQESAEA